MPETVLERIATDLHELRQGFNSGTKMRDEVINDLVELMAELAAHLDFVNKEEQKARRN